MESLRWANPPRRVVRGLRERHAGRSHSRSSLFGNVGGFAPRNVPTFPNSELPRCVPDLGALRLMAQPKRAERWRRRGGRALRLRRAQKWPPGGRGALMQPGAGAQPPLAQQRLGLASCQLDGAEVGTAGYPRVPTPHRWRRGARTPAPRHLFARRVHVARRPVSTGTRTVAAGCLEASEVAAHPGIAEHEATGDSARARL